MSRPNQAPATLTKYFLRLEASIHVQPENESLPCRSQMSVERSPIFRSLQGCSTEERTLTALKVVVVCGTRVSVT